MTAWSKNKAVLGGNAASVGCLGLVISQNSHMFDDILKETWSLDKKVNKPWDKLVGASNNDALE